MNAAIKNELRYYDLIAMAFVATVLISTIAAQKLFAFGPFTFTAGIILFPFAYIFGDILTEVYGYSRSRRIVWAGFIANLTLCIVLAISVALPPAKGWPLQEQFSTILGQVPRIVVASLVAYFCGEFANSYVLAKMKLITNGNHLWARLIGSTIVGQGIDTAIFVIIAFGGILPWFVIASTIISGYIFKVVYEILITPITYIIVRKLKIAEGVDYYDRGTDFNPFKFR